MADYGDAEDEVRKHIHIPLITILYYVHDLNCKTNRLELKSYFSTCINMSLPAGLERKSF